MNFVKPKKWWHSSVDAGKLSMRVKGALTAFVPVIVLAAQLKGWDIAQEGIMAVVDTIVYAVGAIGSLVGVGISIYGYIRRKK